MAGDDIDHVEQGGRQCVAAGLVAGEGVALINAVEDDGVDALRGYLPSPDS